MATIAVGMTAVAATVDRGVAAAAAGLDSVAVAAAAVAAAAVDLAGHAAMPGVPVVPADRVAALATATAGPLRGRHARAWSRGHLRRAWPGILPPGARPTAPGDATAGAHVAGATDAMIVGRVRSR